MQFLPNEFKKITGRATYKGFVYTVLYTHEDGFGAIGEYEISHEDRKTYSEEIVDTTNLHSGFILSKLSNGQYGFLNKSGILLPYRFDIATDFNKYGIALVGNEGKVGWINREFEFYGKPVNEQIEQGFLPMNDDFDISSVGWDEVHGFKEDPILSLLVSYDDKRESFIDPEGTIKVFKNYDDEDIQLFGLSITENFNEKGFALANASIEYSFAYPQTVMLLKNGYFLTNDTLRGLVFEKGMTAEDILKDRTTGSEPKRQKVRERL